VHLRAATASLARPGPLGPVPGTSGPAGPAPSSSLPSTTGPTAASTATTPILCRACGATLAYPGPAPVGAVELCSGCVPSTSLQALPTPAPGGVAYHAKAASAVKFAASGHGGGGSLSTTASVYRRQGSQTAHVRAMAYSLSLRSSSTEMEVEAGWEEAVAAAAAAVAAAHSGAGAGAGAAAGQGIMVPGGLSGDHYWAPREGACERGVCSG
jgi:hypothetical protein